MATLFHLNPRVREIRESLSSLVPTGAAHIVAEYAWHTDSDKLMYALMEFSRPDGSGRIYFKMDDKDTYLSKYELTWTGKESDYEKKEYTESTCDHWISHIVKFANLSPDAKRWAMRKRAKRRHQWDFIGDQYRALIEGRMIKY